jgi:hypothetical protein
VWNIRVIRIIWGFYLGFRAFRLFCGFFFVTAFRDGSVIITSVGFDRMRTLQLVFISFALLL